MTYHFSPTGNNSKHPTMTFPFPIYDALKAIQQYLEQMFGRDGYGWSVGLNFISKDEPANKDNAGDLFVTLLRVEEETSRKPQLPLYNKVEKGYEMVNPEIWLNLHILITSQANDYGTALQQLSRVVYWINSIPSLKHNRKNDGGNGGTDITNYEMVLESLTAEQSNSLWQTLGAKMVPAVAYNVRMVQIGSEPYTEDPFGIIGIDKDNVKYTEKAGEWPIQLTDGSLRLKLQKGEKLKDDETKHLIALLQQIEAKFNGTDFSGTILSEAEKAFLDSHTSNDDIQS